jgi:Zn-dependent protease
MAEERKTYASFHDIPPRDYMYFPKGSLEMGKPGRFSAIEIRDLLISIIVLTVAFSFALTGNTVLGIVINGFHLEALPSGLTLSFLGIITGFFVHELSHKWMAQRYGLWSEFRMYPKGLLLALLMGVTVPIVFAAPGAVMFRGEARVFEQGHTATAGPLANMLLAAFCFPLYLFVVFEDPFLGQLVGFICFINALLAVFNLLPFNPLDGVTIIKWNAVIWTTLFIVSVVLFTLILRSFTLATFF